MISRLWKGLKDKFKSRKELLFTIKQYESLLNINIEKLINQKIVALDQDQTYIITMENADDEEIENAKRIWGMAASRVGWTLPNVLFINKKIKVKKK